MTDRRAKKAACHFLALSIVLGWVSVAAAPEAMAGCAFRTSFGQALCDINDRGLNQWAKDEIGNRIKAKIYSFKQSVRDAVIPESFNRQLRGAERVHDFGSETTLRGMSRLEEGFNQVSANFPDWGGADSLARTDEFVKGRQDHVMQIAGEQLYDIAPAPIKRVVDAYQSVSRRVEGAVTKVENIINDVGEAADLAGEKFDAFKDRVSESFHGDVDELVEEHDAFEFIDDTEALVVDDQQEYAFLDDKTGSYSDEGLPDTFTSEAIEHTLEEYGLPRDAIEFADPIDDRNWDLRGESFDEDPMMAEFEAAPQDGWDDGGGRYEEVEPDADYVYGESDVITDEDSYSFVPFEDSQLAAVDEYVEYETRSSEFDAADDEDLMDLDLSSDLDELIDGYKEKARAESEARLADLDVNAGLVDRGSQGYHRNVERAMTEAQARAMQAMGQAMAIVTQQMAAMQQMRAMGSGVGGLPGGSSVRCQQALQQIGEYDRVISQINPRDSRYHRDAYQTYKAGRSANRAWYQDNCGGGGGNSAAIYAQSMRTVNQISNKYLTTSNKFFVRGAQPRPARQPTSGGWCSVPGGAC